jgi:hypothetical protein
LKCENCKGCELVELVYQLAARLKMYYRGTGAHPKLALELDQKIESLMKVLGLNPERKTGG